MNEHLINPNNFKNKIKEISPRIKRENMSSFGPFLGKLKQLDVTKKVRKMIHYDCNDNANLDGIDDDIPDEDEVYIKENLLMNIREKQIKDRDNHITESNNEDLSIVNINVSILYSEETLSNSKNSLTFNYSPDSTNRMNNTKDQFNSAKNTLKSNLNKSNSIRNLLTENSFIINNSNSNLNTLNSNISKDKKETPGNPYLMEKITSMLNKNKILNNNLINSNNTSNNNINNMNSTNNNINVLDKVYSNTNRDFIEKEVNNININNINYTNFSPKICNNTIDINKSNKVISENLNKNLLCIMQEKLKNSNKKNSAENYNRKQERKHSNDSNDKINDIKNINKIKDLNNKDNKINVDYLSSKKILNPNDYLSPPSSKKRLEDKFYNLTESKNDNLINNVYKNLLDNKNNINEILIKQTLTNSLQKKQKDIIFDNNNQNNFNIRNNILKPNKFDFSRYNFKSEDLTGLLRQKDLQNKSENRKEIISKDSRDNNRKSNSREKSDNINLINHINFKNSIDENTLFDRIHLFEKKNFINALDDKNGGVFLNKNKKNSPSDQPLKQSMDINNDKNNNQNKEKHLNNFTKDKQTKSREIVKNLKDSLLEIDKEIQFSDNNIMTNDKNYSKDKNDINKKLEKEKNIILRDIKSLHIITQKALTTKNNVHLKGDSIEEERINPNLYNSNSTKKALYIDDNSEMPVGVAKSQDPIMDSKNKFNNNKINSNLNYNFDNIICKTDSNYKSPTSNSFNISNSINNYNISEKDRKQIINIININNNYNIANFNLSSNDMMCSTTNPNSNIKENNNSKKKYNAFLMSKQSNKTKIISHSNSNTHKTKNRINPNNYNNKNVSNFTSNVVNNINTEIKTNHPKNLESFSSTNQNHSNALNYREVKNNNLLDNSNLINFNTPIMKNNNSENKQNFSIFKNGNINMNNLNEYINNSKEKIIPNTSKNCISNFSYSNNSDNNQKLQIHDNKIKDILKSYKKDEETAKNKFLKISVGNIKNK